MDSTTIERIAGELYAASPADILFHYTSLSAMQSIVESQSIWATDVRYFSDASELTYLMQALHRGIDERTEHNQSEILRQFHRWLSDRLPQGNMVFAASFSVQGNLLSQWRAYCQPGKGVSLGFRPTAIERAAAEQTFSLGKCLYDQKEQGELVSRVLDAVQSLGEDVGMDSNRHPTQSFFGVFERIENSPLRIGAVFKHPAFSEEVEWRAVSPVFTSYVNAGIRWREGLSMLVPYIHFRLAASAATIPLSDVFVGPTPHFNSAMDSISRYLSSHHISPGVFNCGIPYRTW